VLLTLSLAACRGGSSASPTATTAPTSTPAISATATAIASPTATVGSPEVDGDRVYASVRKLAVEIGPRIAGTPGEIAARDYAAATFESYGYDVELQPFPFDASAFLPVRVDVLPPGEATSAVLGFALKGSGVGVASGRFVFAGVGNPEDYPPGGALGAIALVQRGGGLTFSEKVANALAAGAVGVVIFNDEAGRLIVSLTDPVSIPVAGITQSAGEDLQAKITAGPVDGAVTVSPPKGTGYNVIARPKGALTCATISGGHYDSVAVAGGADDDASGAASVLELARVVAARRLAGANCFVLVGAEEFGLVGSRSFVAQLPPEELNGLRAMINLDVVGVAGGLELIGNDDLIELARVEAQKLGIDATPSSLPNGTGSDHVSFRDHDVPVVMLYRQDNLIHTTADAIDRILPSSLRDTVAVAYATLAKLSS
jgi:aminopeptidase YwaD